MSALGAKIVRGAGFSNEVTVHKVIFDVTGAVDSGATGSLDVFEADGELLVVDFHAVVKTAFTGSSATLKVGSSGDDDACLSIVVANMGANTVHGVPLVEGTPNTKAVPLYLADGAKLIQKVGGATFTAGKIEYTIRTMRA